MSAAEKIPYELLALTSEECAQLWGVSVDYFLRTIACRPGFPARVGNRPATWIAGEVLAYRDANRPGDRRRRVRQLSK